MKNKIMMTNREYAQTLGTYDRVRFIDYMYDTGKAHYGWWDELYKPERPSIFYLLEYFFWVGAVVCSVSGICASFIMVGVNPLEEQLGAYAGFLFGAILFSIFAYAVNRYARYCDKWGVGK